MLDNIIFIIQNITCIFMLSTLIKLLRFKNKDQLQWTACIIVVLAFMWCSGMLAQVYVYHFFRRTFMSLVYYYCLGSYFLPSFLLIFAILYIKPNTKLNHKVFLIFTIPVLFYVLVLTNKYHHFLYIKYAVDESVVFGKYTGLLGIYIFIVYLVIIGYLIYHSRNNFKLLSKQSLIIILGLFIPFTTNLIITFKVIQLPLYANSTSMCFSLLIIYYGVIKYRFLEINPISQKVLTNSISDAFIVIDRNFNVIGYNKAFERQFDIPKSNKGFNFFSLFDQGVFGNHIYQATNDKNKVVLEKSITIKDIDKYFIIDIIPIVKNNFTLGTIVLFKDVTELAEKKLQSEKLLEELKETQDLLILNERYVSLGMLMGGIAHNVRSPLMAIGANIDTLQHLACEYEASISDNTVTIEDHQEIAQEMRDWLNKTSQSLEYIGGLLNYVKNQIQSNIDEAHFKIYELVKYVNQTIKYQQNHKCVLNVNNFVESDIEIKGSISLLTQVIDNLLINSIHSYDDSNGAIEMTIDKKGDYVLFMVKDFGVGIPKDVQDKLFKEMVTTKGKNGTGLGLYISYSIIKSQFKGDIWFDSEPGKGTTFYICLPISKRCDLCEKG